MANIEDLESRIADLEDPPKASTRSLLTSTVAGLPQAGLLAGAAAFATNGRKAGEGVGDGTGVPVWADPTATGGVVWRTYSDNTEVTA